MTLIEIHAVPGTVKPLCDALAVSRATYYRRRRIPTKPARRGCHNSHRRFSSETRHHILETLCQEEFADLSPYQIHAILLERGLYLCSIRTMYRVLAENQAVRERRHQRRHPAHEKPRVYADAPNQVWTWDITKIPGPRRGYVFCLYVVLDLYRRLVVSWTIEERESTRAAKRLIQHGYQAQRVERQKLTVHADRGSPMTYTGLYALFAGLGVTGSHSRPRVSNDNPFSESHF